MSSGPGGAEELSRKARTQETRERIAGLERELAMLDELAQHLAVDVRSVEERLEAARAKCRWLSDKLEAQNRQNQELDSQIATASAEVATIEAQNQLAETGLREKNSQLVRLRDRVRSEQSALLAAERELAEVVESIRRLGYTAECWAESLR